MITFSNYFPQSYLAKSHSLTSSQISLAQLLEEVWMDSLEYRLIGYGDTNLIFLNGFRMHFDSWDKVYPRIAEAGRVLLLNRAGVGLSSKAQAPLTGDVVEGNLRYTAAEAGMKPPYVIVSHSLGGIFANLYARMFPLRNYSTGTGFQKMNVLLRLFISFNFGVRVFAVKSILSYQFKSYAQGTLRRA